MRLGPSYPDIVWDFFARHPRAAASAPDVGPQRPCASASASPAGHVSAGRAVRGGWLGSWALATGDRRRIGLAWSFWSRVTLHEGEPGRWFASAPAHCNR